MVVDKIRNLIPLLTPSVPGRVFIDWDKFVTLFFVTYPLFTCLVHYNLPCWRHQGNFVRVSLGSHPWRSNWPTLNSLLANDVRLPTVYVGIPLWGDPPSALGPILSRNLTPSHSPSPLHASTGTSFRDSPRLENLETHRVSEGPLRL